MRFPARLSLNERQQSWVACVVIALLALAAYHNSFSGPFIFDDEISIEDNSSIRSLWPLWPVITPLPGGTTVSGRPVLNLSFALNYAAGGTEVWGYHAVNLALHILAACALCGLIWRTLTLPKLRVRFGADARLIALAIAGLWVLHPIQTESVAYIVQRAESLAGLFYLLTLYGLVRGIGPGGSRVWLWTSVVACAVGMGCKEVVVSAPVLALLYDRTFVVGTFAEAWRRRRLIYSAMAATWLLLGYCVLATHNRGGTAGFGVGPSTIEYLLTQGCAILEYLRLSIWPSPLILDYGTAVITDPRIYIIPVVIVGLLGVVTFIGVWRNASAGFLGFGFFALLAPSSSIISVATQTIATHRMYLPLAVVIAVLILGLYGWLGRRSLLIVPVVAAIFGWLTFERNKDYISEVAIWRDTVLKCPGNFHAVGYLSRTLLMKGYDDEAKSVLKDSLFLRDADANRLGDLGVALYQGGSTKAGLLDIWSAYVIDPEGRNRALNLGVALAGIGQKKIARKYLQEALVKDPEDALAKRALEVLDLETAQLPPSDANF